MGDCRSLDGESWSDRLVREWASNKGDGRGAVPTGGGAKLGRIHKPRGPMCPSLREKESRNDALT